ncbi:YppG family protein [Oceanobacillus salinisoli]|uniref:YppG family protein n=1 Tax=Oceanobacillus salinisoli TaxID=2678611 RepID=UPI0018CC0432|nr:YppG family protein [Oceanobacillus salinisoli]
MYHRNNYYRPIESPFNYPYNSMDNHFSELPQQNMNYSQVNPMGQVPMNENSNQTPYDYFQKPEQPMSWPNNTPFEPNQFQQPQMPSNAMSQFQKENGQLDLDKVLNTVGQLANTYHQVAPIFQQFGNFIKNFRAGS